MLSEKKWKNPIKFSKLVDKVKNIYSKSHKIRIFFVEFCDHSWCSIFYRTTIALERKVIFFILKSKKKNIFKRQILLNLTIKFTLYYPIIISSLNCSDSRVQFIAHICENFPHILDFNDNFTSEVIQSPILHLISMKIFHLDSEMVIPFWLK